MNYINQYTYCLLVCFMAKKTLLYADFFLIQIHKKGFEVQLTVHRDRFL